MGRSLAVILPLILWIHSSIYAQQPAERDSSWQLIWHDEFDVPLNRDTWHSEHGFVRNHEAQWYQAENAFTEDGLLVLEARLDSIPNPRYRKGSNDWQRQRPYAKYSSASVNTRKSFSFKFGQMEVRARIPAVEGSWPAIWTLGMSYPWPSCGECDIMEFYHIKGIPHILANAAWGENKPFHPLWNTKAIPYSHFLEKDPLWSQQFHTWLMDWTEDYIRIYLDGELINDIDLSKTINGSIGNNTNPFHSPHYILLNLALGGDNGGRISDDTFPLKYEIDYVRVWQRKKEEAGPPPSSFPPFGRG
ncbi:MAG: glycoside hydrolase family 16 protein [Prevotellaceae bacterium]|nr:glycoside hydrolase family 16 protein [Prevotellaceae bacterium]